MPKAKFEGYKNSPEWLTVIYDFALDGGAIGAIELLELKDNVVVHDMYVEEITPPASGGAATLEIGENGGDADGYLTQVAYNGLAAVTGDAQKGAFLTGGLRKKMAAEKTVELTIATAVLTGGKLAISFLLSGGH